MTEIHWMSLAELARELDRGRRPRSRSSARTCSASILDGRLHAFVDVYRDHALAAAAKADRERAAGRLCGPLHGLPIALKDLLHVRGMTTAGSKARPFGIADQTATAWERLHAAGMIALGKTHLVEFAFGGWGRNAPMGAPWNPWDMQTHRVAGARAADRRLPSPAGSHRPRSGPTRGIDPHSFRAVRTDRAQAQPTAW